MLVKMLLFLLALTVSQAVLADGQCGEKNIVSAKYIKESGDCYRWYYPVEFEYNDDGSLRSFVIYYHRRKHSSVPIKVECKGLFCKGNSDRTFYADVLIENTQRFQVKFGKNDGSFFKWVCRGQYKLDF